MHMLKQVQRGLAAPVEVVHIAGFDFQGSSAARCWHTASISDMRSLVKAPSAAGHRRAEASRCAAVHRGSSAGSPVHAASVAKRSGSSEHGGSFLRPLQTVALIGMVRGFLPPNMLTSSRHRSSRCQTKPQPPRMSNAFSAYSRWAVGITKRSS